MNKYLLILPFLFFTISATAEIKKKQPIEPPPVERVVDLPVATGDEHNIIPNNIIMPASAVTRIIATKMNGQEIVSTNLEELESIDLSQLKALTFKTMVSDKSMDDEILRKVMNEATQLEDLEIENYVIATFPEIKTTNHRLKKLKLQHNKLKALPASISNLVGLENFSSDNPLKELPETFSQLKNLKELGLDHTEFPEFPEVIFGLNKLSVLYVSGNNKASTKIKEIPDLFRQLPDLKEFGVINAALSSLPESISTLHKLENVSFSYNQFNDFPEVLAVIPGLQYVAFSNNPLKWDKLIVSLKKIKWRGPFFLYETGLSKKQYEAIQHLLTKIDVYYDEMND